MKITKGTLHFYGQRKTNISTVHSISLKKVQMSMLLLQVVTMLDIQVIFLDSVFLLSFEMKFDMRISKIHSAQNKNEVWPLNFVHWFLKSCIENSKSRYLQFEFKLWFKRNTNKDTLLKCRFIKSNFFPNENLESWILFSTLDSPVIKTLETHSLNVKKVCL